MGTNTAIRMSPRRIAAGAIGGLIIALLVIGSPRFTFGQQPQAQQPQAKTFPSAGQAAQALYEAVRNRDDGAVEAILGAGPELTSSGDEAIDTLEHEQFAEKYLQMHRLVRETDGSVVLYIGAENWPFPVPLVDRNGKWRFDPDAGAQEITARTIGENETFAFRVSKHVGNQHAGKATQPAIEGEKTDQLALEFARRLGSNNPDASQSFQGYNFKTAAEQGQGVLLVAYPANYRVSRGHDVHCPSGRICVRKRSRTQNSEPRSANQTQTDGRLDACAVRLKGSIQHSAISIPPLHLPPCPESFLCW